MSNYGAWGRVDSTGYNTYRKCRTVAGKVEHFWGGADRVQLRSDVVVILLEFHEIGLLLRGNLFKVSCG